MSIKMKIIWQLKKQDWVLMSIKKKSLSLAPPEKIEGWNFVYYSYKHLKSCK
jgi:hypothetical protein